VVIEHEGIIKEINQKSLVVGITTNSACSSCQAKKSCHLSESVEKEIEIEFTDQPYTPGEHVMVFYRSSLGHLAIFLAYILPFILVIAILAISKLYTISEGIAGLSALGTLIPYYTLIYFFRKKLKQTFSFSVRKLEITTQTSAHN
jgi:positive regulator of sigma E activity